MYFCHLPKSTLLLLGVPLQTLLLSCEPSLSLWRRVPWAGWTAAWRAPGQPTCDKYPSSSEPSCDLEVQHEQTEFFPHGTYLQVERLGTLRQMAELI